MHAVRHYACACDLVIVDDRWELLVDIIDVNQCRASQNTTEIRIQTERGLKRPLAAFSSDCVWL